MFAQHRWQRAWVVPIALLFGSAPALAAGVSAKDAAALFSQRCAGCHAEDGRGVHRPGVKLPDLRAPGWQRAHTQPQIEQIIADGVPGRHMPAFKNRLDKDEISALAGFVRSLARPSAP